MSIQNSSTAPIARRRLEGKVAVITGGASGIGASTARLFVHQGAKVIIADVQDDLGSSLCQELNVSDDEETISYVHCNITIDSDVKNLVDTAIAKYGKLDIMYNNAGTAGGTADARILETQDHEFKRILDVNVFGSYLGAKHAARVMIPAKKGSIIFTASLSSIIVGVGEVPHGYVASKHAVVGMAKNLCVELGQYGIRVNCISPFGLATPMTRELMGMMEKEKIEELVASAATLKGAILEAEDIAEAALYLGSDESKYVSGVNLPIDGGYSTHNPAFPMKMKILFSSLGV